MEFTPKTIHPAELPIFQLLTNPTTEYTIYNFSNETKKESVA
jgi:hypothetical protein